MIIIIDTREQNPFNFSIYGFEQIVTKLDQGDYSICGYEDVIAIERKASAIELAMNLGSKYKTFIKEMERLKSYKVKFILCEFPEQHIWDFPNCPGIPNKIRKKIQIRGQFLMNRLQDIEANYGVPTIFSDDREDALEKTLGILQDFEENNT